MIVQKDFLKKLKDFGLNSYESKLWTSLLSRGVSTAGELSDIANVPRSRSYDVLESLEKKGFIIMKIGKPIKYIAVPPEEVLERVKKKIIGDTDRQVKSIEALKSSEILKELSILHNQGVEFIEPSELSGSLKGRSNLYNHLETMMKTAEKSVTMVTTTQDLIRKADVLKTTMEKIASRGVKIRIAAPITKECKDVIKDLKKIADIKHVDKLKARFCVIDDKEVMFMLLDDSEVHATYDTGVWVNTPFFSSALTQMFDTLWKDMKPAEQLIKS